MEGPGKECYLVYNNLFEGIVDGLMYHGCRRHPHLKESITNLLSGSE